MEAKHLREHEGWGLISGRVISQLLNVAISARTSSLAKLRILSILSGFRSALEVSTLPSTVNSAWVPFAVVLSQTHLPVPL